MKHTTTLANKILAFFLALMILAGTLSTFVFNTAAAPDPNVVADAATIKDWHHILGTAADGSISTEHAGTVWTDKSVFTNDELESYFPGLGNKLQAGTNNFGKENFIVGLSTIGSNTEIIGYSTTPTDTMLVLDVSASMADDSKDVSMIRAANRAIDQLLALNNHNRVSVVLYSGNTQNGSSQASTGTVLLPMDRYTTNSTVTINNGTQYRPNYETIPSYLTLSNSTVGVDRTVRNSNNQEVRTTKRVSGGTYIQNGLYLAYNAFPAGDNTVIPADQLQAGTQRMPILVLMSDGAPTTATVNYNNVGTSDAGDGRTNHATAEVGFLTQLTASWVRAKVQEKYNGTAPLFYTLGIGTSNSQTATGVLNPASANNNAATHWNNFTRNKTVTLTLPDTSNQNNNGTRSHYSTVTPADNTTLVKNYVDKYWSVANNGLSGAFQEIVNEIILQSRYYSTLVSSNDHENDGFVYFTDEIGSYMEVKNIKGIHLGEGRLCTGAQFADYFTNDTFQLNGVPTDYGREVIGALTTRLNITETQLASLLEIARDNGYIAYNANTGAFSNYIAWYADEDINFAGAYNPKVATLAGETPKYLIKSYIYLGEETISHAKSDMLYALIRVREELATGRQYVDAALPASLLPMVTQTITVNSDSAVLDENTITGLTSNADDVHPAVLLYEVGLKSEITPYNLESKVTESFRENADGTYSFYSNRWRDSAGNTADFTISDAENFFTQEIHTTAVHMVPSYENEAYYYTTDTLIYQQSGNGYQLVPDNQPPNANGSYYWLKQSIIKAANGDISVKKEYLPISVDILGSYGTPNSRIAKTNEGWVVLAGTTRKIIKDRTPKAANETGTIAYSDIPLVNDTSLAGGEDYMVYFFEGNNGKLTVSPAQGIKLTKTVSEPVEGAPNAFTFDIALTGNNIENTYLYRWEKADGTVETGDINVINNVIEVTIGAGDVFYINGLDKDITYTVTERYNNYYVGTSANASGTVSLHTINEVNFVNSPRGYGSLLVEKDVTHPFANNAVPNALLEKAFTVTVALTGTGLHTVTNTANAVPAVNGNTYTYSLTLKDGDSVLFNNVPENTGYAVTESNLPTGFTLTNPDALDGTIDKNAQSNAVLINNYTQAPVSPKITVQGSKTIAGGTWGQNDVYQAALQKLVYNSNEELVPDGNPVVVNIDPANGYSIDMSNISLPAVGSYIYAIHEVKPANPVPDIAYDTSYGLFVITVTDNDADGLLEIANVASAAETATVTGNSTLGYIVEKDFVNTYLARNIVIPVEKQVIHETTGQQVAEHRGGILFGLYESTTATNAVHTALTDKNGEGEFTWNITKSAYDQTQYFYMREILPPLDTRVVGMTYDTGWKYVIAITWPAADAEPTIRYYHYDAARPNGLGSELTGANAVPLVLTNRYDDSTVSTPAIAFSGNKTLNGRTLKNGEFRFELYETGANFAVSGTTPLQSKVNTGNAITFDNVTFKTPGTKYLVIKEVNEAKSGITYDTTEYHVIVNVVKSDVVDGTTAKTVLTVPQNGITIHKTGHGTVAQTEIDFVNTYTINDRETVTLSGTKLLTGREINEGEFTFVLTQTESDYSTVVANGIQLKTANGLHVANNKNKALFAFEEIAFTKPGTSYFTIEEQIPDEAVNNTHKGVTYSTQKFNVKVTVNDHGDGTLEAPVVQYAGGAQPTFNNSYTANGVSVPLKGVKTLNGRPLALQNEEFTFDLYEADKNFEITNTTPVASAKNNAQGNYSITLDYEDGEEGIYYYELKERIPEDRQGVQYDTTEYHITVHVADSGEGNLLYFADIDAVGGETGVDQDQLNFNNGYAAANGFATITGTKTLAGRTLEADEFTFLLYEATKEGQITNTTPAKAKNAADGTFSFEVIEYTATGSNFYLVKEDTSVKEENVTYDETVYLVEVTVTDNNKGLLETAQKITVLGKTDEVALTFKNTYTAPTEDPKVPEDPKDPETPQTPTTPEKPQIPSVPATPPVTPAPEKPTQNPDTGDHSNMMLWLALLFVSGGALTGMGIWSKKKSK